MSWQIKDMESGRTWDKDSKQACKDAIEDFGGDMDLEIIQPKTADGGSDDVIDEDSPTALAENPIEWLRAKNVAYVNTVQGTPAISKRGFRYIQSEFEITTTSEVVKWIDDPVGVIVWAKAELPNGRSAEAHGEGYLSENKVDDNEFVRYSDTRAKNRAISDLTAAGALAESELSG